MINNKIFGILCVLLFLVPNVFSQGTFRGEELTTGVPQRDTLPRNFLFPGFNARSQTIDFSPESSLNESSLNESSLNESSLNETERTSEADPTDDAEAFVPEVKPPVDDNSIYFGMVPFRLGIYTEVGNVNELNNEIERLQEEVRGNSTLSDAQNSIGVVRNSAGVLEENGFLYTGITGSSLFPLVFQLESGQAISVDLGFEVGTLLEFNQGANPVDITSDIAGVESCINFVNGLTNDLIDCANALDTASQSGGSNFNCGSQLNPANASEFIESCGDIFSLTSDSGVLLRGYTGFNFGLGYSDRLASFRDFGVDWLSGDLSYGIQAEYRFLNPYSGEFSVQNSEELSDFLQTLSKNSKSFSMFDLHAGVQYESRWFSANLGAEHLLSPSVEYSDSDVVLETNPYLGLNFFRMFGEEKKGLILGFYQDLGKKTQLIGIQDQWQIISISYIPPYPYTPDFRISQRRNLIRTKLEYYQFGLSFGSYMDLNIAYTPENINVGGTDLPRSFIFNLSFNVPV